VQIVYYLQWITLLEARRAWPQASLEATMRNHNGGKPDPTDPDAPKPRKAHLIWTAEECLPPWASLDVGPGVWTQASARDALDNAARLPIVALARLDFGRLRALAGA
jgi:hypothetical protein